MTIDVTLISPSPLEGEVGGAQALPGCALRERDTAVAVSLLKRCALVPPPRPSPSRGEGVFILRQAGHA